MSSRSTKKSGSKRKQTEKKAAKSRASDTKQKHAVEATKDQIPELEKEIFTIKINELESKLSRKKQLCAYMEDEINIFKVLFEEKQLLKNESMTLLNKAYEEFGTEISLLNQEINVLEHQYQEKKSLLEFCDKEEKLKILKILEKEIESKLSEAEKCCDEISELNVRLKNVEELNLQKENDFINRKKNITEEFKTILNSIFKEIEFVNNHIGDRNLKFNLLPDEYKVLIRNEMQSKRWLQKILDLCEHLIIENYLIKQQSQELRKMKEITRKNLKKTVPIKTGLMEVSAEETNIPLSNTDSKKKKVNDTEKDVCIKDLNRKHLQHLKHVEDLKKQIEELENSIKLLESTDENKSKEADLINLIKTAGNLIKREL